MCIVVPQLHNNPLSDSVPPNEGNSTNKINSSHSSVWQYSKQLRVHHDESDRNLHRCASSFKISHTKPFSYFMQWLKIRWNKRTESLQSVSTERVNSQLCAQILYRLNFVSLGQATTEILSAAFSFAIATCSALDVVRHRKSVLMHPV